ncbi:DnaJ-like protein [Actinobacteria bacterium IMCC26207]|nr:DnaJ-like protein [Actinobacteria bacterium IMCC26207]
MSTAKIDAARLLLGVEAACSETEIRAAYRMLLLRTHPDINSKADATERTMALTSAYLLLTSLAVDPAPARAQQEEPAAEQGRRRAQKKEEEIEILLLGDLTISVAAPASETLMLLIDMAHELGEISYLDPSAGLLEIVIEFVEEPTSSVLLSMQGRGNATTEVFCSVEPLSGGISPPADAVARLLHRTLTHAESP